MKLGEYTSHAAITLLDGRPMEPGSLRGKVVMTVFWATWCHVCRVEMPSYQKLFKRHAPSGFEIVAFSVDDDPAAVKTYVAETDLTFKLAMRTPAVKANWGPVPGTPLVYVSDRRGIIRARYLGAPDQVELEKLIVDLLA